MHGSGSTSLLSSAELKRALDATAALAELDELTAYPQVSATLMSSLIPCDIASCTIVEPGATAAVAADPIDSLDSGDGAIFGRFAYQHPLVSHYARTRDQQAWRISDFATRRELHATDLYDHLYKPLGTEYQLAVTTASRLRPGAIIGLTVSRHTRDFTMTERELLGLLAPHFRATLARLSDHALIDAMLAARNESGAGIALIDPNGLVVQATARARSAGLSEGEPLPWPLRQLLTTRSRRQQLSLGDAPLSAELIVNIGPGLHAIRLTPAQRQPVAAALRGLGLTPRQAEILALITRAQTTAQIAVQLNISPRTVEKHLEAVYERLEVTNRSQAIIRVLNLAPGE